MSYYMSAVQSTLADDSNYDTYANLEVGSNGNPYGDPTTMIGDIYGEENWAFYTWDSNLSGGFDTGTVAIAFDVKSDGTETLNAGTQDALTYQTSALGSITSVVLEAAVTTNAEAKWSNVTVEFLKSGSIVETDNLTSGPDANSINSGSSTTRDQLLTVTPTVQNCDEAIVTGGVRLRSPGNNYPGSTAMFCNAFVNGANG